MEAVHILVNVDGGKDDLAVNVSRQGQLHQDPIHLGVLVEVTHYLEQLFSCYLMTNEINSKKEEKPKTKRKRNLLLIEFGLSSPPFQLSNHNNTPLLETH